VRSVVVGCGAMSRVWAEAARELGVEVVGAVDIDSARAAAFVGAHGVPDAAIGATLAPVLAAASPDMVFDVVVPDARHSVVAEALAAGCHVLSEKPMAPTLAAAKDLVARARAADRVHAVIQNRRYLGAIRRIKRLLDSGELGALTSLHCDFFLAPHFGGFREEMEHVLLLDMAIHTFDAARYLAGGRPEAVYCREWNASNSWYRQGACAAAIFELGSGVMFGYHGSWCADGLMTSWEGQWRLVCETGTITWDGFEGIAAARTTRRRDGLFDASEPVEIPALSGDDRIGGHLGVMRDFLAAVQGGPPPETVGSDNILSLAMALGAIESAERGMRVPITV
jgi:predicted dehydrogenase